MSPPELPLVECPDDLARMLADALPLLVPRELYQPPGTTAESVRQCRSHARRWIERRVIDRGSPHPPAVATDRCPFCVGAAHALLDRHARQLDSGRRCLECAGVLTVRDLAQPVCPHCGVA